MKFVNYFYITFYFQLGLLLVCLSGCKQNKNELYNSNHHELYQEFLDFEQLNSQLGGSFLEGGYFIIKDFVNVDSTLLKSIKEANLQLRLQLESEIAFKRNINEPVYALDYADSALIESYRISVSHWPSKHTPDGITKIVRIESTQAGKYIFFKQVVFKNDSILLLTDRKMVLEEQEWKEFKRKVYHAKFWMLPNDEYTSIDRKGSHFYPPSYNELSHAIEGFLIENDNWEQTQRFHKKIRRDEPCGATKELIDYTISLATELK